MKFPKILITTILGASLVALFACSTPTSQPNGSDAGLASGDSGSIGTNSQVKADVVIGTMSTEDILPMWVALDEGLFEQNSLNATIQVFQSAQELSTAVASGAVDMAMTDPMVSATLEAAGNPVVMKWVTLGATPEQGRFGLMASPESGITTLEQLAGIPIGVGSCTVPEYVMDKLLAAAGVPADKIVGEEIKKVPVRYEMMAANQVAASALPGSLLALGEATGMVLIADDSASENLSQSVMIAQSAWANTAEGQATITLLSDIWDQAATKINATPEKYRALLAEKAQLPEVVVATYPISKYPVTALPTAAMIDPVLDWMQQKGYLEKTLKYDPSTGAFIAGI